MTKLNNLYDKCFPLVKISRKEFCDKPWITNEIRKSIQKKIIYITNTGENLIRKT